MRFGYADPPYLGQARRHYGPDAREVNHELLIAHLNEYDGWALSCSSPSLRTILPLCPEDVRVMAWVKPFGVFKPGVNPAYVWEPIVLRGGRSLGRLVDTERDWCWTVEIDEGERDVVRASITLRRGTHGAKPRRFSEWLFRVAGLTPADEFIDLFPGSGAVSQAWDVFCRQGSFQFATSGGYGGRDGDTG